MSRVPTIEQLFDVYYQTSSNRLMNVDEERRPFFCGFAACLRAVDALSEVTWEDRKEGDLAWQRLQAEFDKFATAENMGDLSVNH